MKSAIPYHIFTVTDEKNLARFINFPYKLYANNPYWAPPLKSEERSFLMDVPSLDDGIETEMFLVTDDHGEVAGRIQVLINHHEIAFSGEKTARFNKLDFIDDQNVSSLLLQEAEQWTREKGMTQLMGPFGYSNLDAAGTLTEGFDKLSSSAAIYNYPYYIHHIRAAGYQNYLEWLEHEFEVPSQVPEKISRFSELTRRRYGLTSARFDTKSEKQKRSAQMMELINVCYAHLPGFVPLSEQLKDYYYKKYMPLVNKDYISLIVDQGDDLVGFGLTIPSYTKALQKANGSFYPLGFYHLWQASRNNDRAEMLLIAIHPEYQQKGLTSLIFEQILQKYIENGIKLVESNPEQVDNMNVRNLWKGYSYRLHKKRVCLSKDLRGG
ncbi:GNAT family N-acetyltransferase [Membranicola marinus]|uniref:GNAT family N-acetyltransferase n=1 Tax=Membranihabitans marinus TaxID=1227546 RepID=A0A953HUZ0_9BACT|nr:GNAT family N-acetyltransferase [Membranihabitans marinus]MBY5956986.1 GNAT family N-acetyltransferase [Membranihabitans marinus]